MFQFLGWDDIGWLWVRSEGGVDVLVEFVMVSGKFEDRCFRWLFKQRKVYFVIFIYGLYSNLGVDMLFLKESIDVGVKKVKVDVKV